VSSTLSSSEYFEIALFVGVRGEFSIIRFDFKVNLSFVTYAKNIASMNKPRRALN